MTRPAVPHQQRRTRIGQVSNIDALCIAQTPPNLLLHDSFNSCYSRSPYESDFFTMQSTHTDWRSQIDLHSLTGHFLPDLIMPNDAPPYWGSSTRPRADDHLPPTCVPAPTSQPHVASNRETTVGLTPTQNMSGDVDGLQCPHPTCRSRKVYERQCGLDKHYRSHFRRFFCEVPGCNGKTGGPPGFATRKDRDRHERAHSPTMACQYCGKLFSRVDNLDNHLRCVHKRDAS